MPRRSKSNPNAEEAIVRPKHPLSAYNLFYRYKRSKLLKAYNAGDKSKETIIRITATTPGLEDHSNVVSAMTYEQTVELSRAEVRAVLLDKLAPADTSKRCHRKTHGAMTFLEMNKIMVGSWKSISDTSRRVFEELAEEGRRSYKKRLAEFDEKYPDWEEPWEGKRMSKKKSTDSDTDTTSSSTPDDTPSNINPKIYARIVSDLSSDDDMLFYPDATVSSFNNQYATSMPSLPHTTPIGNSKPSAMFVTPEQCAKPTLPSGQYISRIAAPVVPESISSTYFDCLDFDLTKEESEERAHLASFGELPSIFDQDMKREEEVPPSSGCSTSSEEIEGMCNMTDAFPKLPFLPAENPKQQYKTEESVHDFAHSISALDDNLHAAFPTAA